jgi:hypothetical protein
MDKFANGRIPTNTNDAIILFYEKILATDGQRFGTIDVVNFVQQYNFGTTEGSIARGVRKLRASGRINYAVANHKLGIFQAIPLEVKK